MANRVLGIYFFEFLNECQRLRWLCEAIVNENLQDVLTDNFPKIDSIIAKLYSLDGPLQVIEELFPYHDDLSKLQKFNDELKDSLESEKDRKEKVTLIPIIRFSKYHFFKHPQCLKHFFFLSFLVYAAGPEKTKH